MSLFSRIKSIFSSRSNSSPKGTVDPEDAHWQAVYDAREDFYRHQFGEFPPDILKLGPLFGVWPGGGLFVIPATKIAPDAYLYTTFGLTNPDMPATTTLITCGSSVDAMGRPLQSTTSLGPKQPAPTPPGAAGYGYELAILAKEDAQWPLWVLQWAVNAELLGDAGLLQRVEDYGGLTIEGIEVGENDEANFLFAKARPPLPTGTKLPNGNMELLITTVITDDEMRWGMENGREELLNRLLAEGVGQTSLRDRPSIVA